MKNMLWKVLRKIVIASPDYALMRKKYSDELTDHLKTVREYQAHIEKYIVTLTKMTALVNENKDLVNENKEMASKLAVLSEMDDYDCDATV